MRPLAAARCLLSSATCNRPQRPGATAQRPRPCLPPPSSCCPPPGFRLWRDTAPFKIPARMETVGPREGGPKPVAASWRAFQSTPHPATRTPLELHGAEQTFRHRRAAQLCFDSNPMPPPRCHATTQVNNFVAPCLNSTRQMTASGRTFMLQVGGGRGAKRPIHAGDWRPYGGLRAQRRPPHPTPPPSNPNLHPQTPSNPSARGAALATPLKKAPESPPSQRPPLPRNALPPPSFTACPSPPASRASSPALSPTRSSRPSPASWRRRLTGCSTWGSRWCWTLTPTCCTSRSGLGGAALAGRLLRC